MMFGQLAKHLGAKFLFTLVCFVIVVTGLKAAASVLIPVVLALFLAVLSMPVMFALRKRGMWRPLAIVLTVLLDAPLSNTEQATISSGSGCVRTKPKD